MDAKSLTKLKFHKNNEGESILVCLFVVIFVVVVVFKGIIIVPLL